MTDLAFLSTVFEPTVVDRPERILPVMPTEEISNEEIRALIIDLLIPYEQSLTEEELFEIDFWKRF